jgi:hypothetical protein
LRISGTSFVRPDGAPFQWRGITAFRLVEMVAHGRKAEAGAFLDWAAGRKLTVVRVFTMARHLFQLAPAEGVRALPELLAMAAARGIHVEVVALADTADLPVDMDAHVRAVGEIADRHPNALVEIANEPAHPTQARAIHDVRELKRLAALVAAGIPVSYGSAEEDEAFAGGSYATYHFPRSAGAAGWGHVLALAKGAGFVKAWGKPVVNDEPIGAAPVSIAGRRDSDPDRFRGAALLSRMAGLGATFHYEEGLQARIPSGAERRCFDAWNQAWSLLPADIEQAGVFHAAGEPGAAAASFTPGHAAGVFERQAGDRSYVLALGVRDDLALRLTAGWRIVRTQRFGAVHLITAKRSSRPSVSP